MAKRKLTSYERKMAECIAEYNEWAKSKKVKNMATYNGQARFATKDVSITDMMLNQIFPKEIV